MHIALIDLGNEIAVRQIDRVRARVGHEQVNVELVAQNQQQKQHQQASDPSQSPTAAWSLRTVRTIRAVRLSIWPHWGTSRRPVVRVAQRICCRGSARRLTRIFPPLLCPMRVSIPHCAWHLLSRTDGAPAPPSERNVGPIACRTTRAPSDRYDSL